MNLDLWREMAVQTTMPSPYRANPIGSRVVSFDYDEKKTYSVRIAAVDTIGTSYVQSFSLSILPAPPTNILLSATEIEENQPAGTVVGTFSGVMMRGVLLPIKILPRVSEKKFGSS